MFHKLLSRLSYANVMSTIAVFGALGTGGAYAANTIGASDIIDNQVTSAEIRDDNLGFGGLGRQDLGPGSVGSSEVLDFSLGNGDLLTGSVDSRVVTADSLTAGDIATGAVGTSEVLDNTLTGADINESTLNLPQAPTTTTFAFGSNPSLGPTLTQVAIKSLPAGSYSLTATVHGRVDGFFAGDHTTTLYCEARSGSTFIGGATDRSVLIDAGEIDRTIPIIGGLQVPAGGGHVSIWCSSQSTDEIDARMMITRLDGFS